MLLRLFSLWYDLDVIEEEAFLKWKEDLSEQYPGKGQALFQVRSYRRCFYSLLEGAVKLNFAPFCPLEMLFNMVSFFPEVNIFIFWPKTMDYNKAF